MSETFTEVLEGARRNPRSKERVTALLKLMRLNKIRDPRLAVEFGSLALTNFPRALGDDKWTILEQVFIAALDTGNGALEEKCLGELREKFLDSSRVKRLVGMQQEARRQFGPANKTYDDLLEANPANALAAKRRVAVLKGQGKMEAAVQELNKYLEQSQADVTAWQELADLYLSMSKYDAAAFCFEELVLHDPMNHIVHCRLAELYYTLGGPDHTLAARKHFSQSLEIKKKGNARALFGLAACSNALLQPGGASVKAPGARGGQQEPEVNAALLDLARDELGALYRKKQPALAEAVESLLDDMGPP